MFTRTIALLALAAAPCMAQQPRTVVHSPVGTARMLFEDAAHNVIQTAIDVPEDKYSWKPVAGVRSFAELFNHVAGSQRMFCAMALGEKPPAEDLPNPPATKDAIVAELKASTEACSRAYAQDDASAAQDVVIFGQPGSRLMALMMNAGHDNEHYGNLVTYMRINGMVPVTSRPAPTPAR